jgi:hypothetical protein
MVLLSTFFNASKTGVLSKVVELDKTVVIACGKYWLRSAIVSSMMAAKLGCRVGSPLPEKVMLSGASFCCFICSSVCCSMERTCSLVGKC